MRNSPIPPLDEITLASSLNPEPRTPLSQATEIRAEARLQQIVATPRQPTRAIGRAGRKPAHLLRWAAIPVAAAAALGIGIALPSGIGSAPAQASMLNWTAQTDPLTDAEMSSADAVCRDGINSFLVSRNAEIQRWNETFADNPEIPTMSSPVSLVDQPALAERRGDWGLLGYPQDDSLTLCLVWFGAEGPQLATFASPGGIQVSEVVIGHSGGSNFRTNEFGFTPVGAVGNDGISLRQSGEITIPADAKVIPPESGVFTLVGGQVGADVTELTLHTETGGDVQAAVANGFWLAWWPGAMGGPESYWVDLIDGPAGWNIDGTPYYDDGDSVRMWSNPGSAIITGYTTTLSDGSRVTTEADWESCNEAEDCFFDPAAAQARYEEYLAQVG